MKKALIPILLIFFAGGLYFFSANSRVTPAKPEAVPRLYAAEGEYPNLAAAFSGNINEISPTPSIDEGGWIIHRVSFVKDEPYAYVEYTDTKVALKLLLQYYYKDAKIKTKVLATFVPDEYGAWNLDFGRDLAAGLPVSHYIFKGDTGEWVKED